MKLIMGQFRGKSYILFLAVGVYFLFLIDGIGFSMPVEAIPDESTQLLNVYAMIQQHTLKLPYESAYTIWVHLFLLPFTLLYWGVNYIYIGMPDIASFKVHVAANYVSIIPFLRVICSAFFLFSSLLLSQIVRAYFGLIASILFIVFIWSDLLVFINLHYSKHWTIDFAFLFLSLFLFHKYLCSIKKSSLLLSFSAISFGFGVISSPPLIVFVPFHVMLLVTTDSSRINIKDLFLVMIIGAVMFGLTLFLGPGLHLGRIFFGDYSGQLSFSWELFFRLINTLYDYNPSLSLLFVVSSLTFTIKKDFKSLLLLSPALLYLFVMSLFHYEPRYSLFVVFNVALFVSICFVKYFNINWIRNLAIVLALSVNAFYLYSWNEIITKTDTRVLARNWLIENVSTNDFIIYNSLSFNYLPMTNKSVDFLLNNFPNAVGSREKLQKKLHLPDGVNGVILRKINEGRYEGADFVARLIKSGFTPILLNERFGKNAHFSQPAGETYFNILENCKYIVEDVFLPYDYIPNNFEEYGDIVYNFTGVFDSLNLFTRPGPIMTVYRFDSKQPSTCS